MNRAKAQGVVAPVSLASYDGSAGVLVDTNVWLDCIDEASPWHDWASEQLQAWSERCPLHVNIVIYSELLIPGPDVGAMDALLEIIMRDKAWNNELARKTYVAILELLTKPQPKPAAGADKAKGTLELAGPAAVASADPVVDQYRRKLSMALF